MDKKYQIFISSTFADLKEERQAVSRAILDMGHIPAGMEMFPAADVEQLTYIKKVIDECDYYILIIGARYGSLDEQGVSYTEREFEYAIETGKTVLAFLHRDTDSIPLGKTDKDDAKRQKLERFINKVATGRLVQFWDNAVELRANSIISLTKAFSENPQTGWVRADSIASSSTMADIIKFRNENDELKEKIENMEKSFKPKFDDAADLNTYLEVPYTYYNSNNYKRTSSVKISYSTFLQWLGPTIHTPTTIAGACVGLERAIKERCSVQGTKLDVPQTTVLDALMHLVATGHVKMWPSRLENGHNVTAYQLTDTGVRVWQETSYVKAERKDA